MSFLNAARVEVAIDFDNRNALDLLPSLRELLSVPGSAEQYDGAIVERIATIQSQHGLAVDGKIGQHTREALSGLVPPLDARPLWPAAGGTVEQKFRHYARICEQLNQPVPAESALLIGLRGVALGGELTQPVVSRRAYDEAFILLQRSGSSASVHEFSGATHPYQRTSMIAPDPDRDGIPDVGTIRPGRYLLEQLDAERLHVKQLNGDARIPTWRDTNHDGSISRAEASSSEARPEGPQVLPGVGDFATEVLLHPGFDAQKPDGKFYSSIGCQTAPRDEVRAIAALEALEYLLVDAREALTKLPSASPENIA